MGVSVVGQISILFGGADLGRAACRRYARAMSKTHPHIESPTVAQLRELLEGRPEAIVDTYLAFHGVVLEALPDVNYSVDTVDCAIGYGARQYGYGGWGMAAVTPFTNWVSLTLMQGAKLGDSELLAGTATMRHVKLSAPADVVGNRPEITRLVQAAAELFEE